MAKKIMVLSGSPRKNGNTNTVVQWFAEGAKDAGATVEVIDITKLKSKFGGCIACMGCQKSDKYECVVDDDVKPVLARIPDADVLVFATPTYFFGPTAQMKSMLDRMYSLIKFNAAKGGYDHNLGRLNMALIATAGGGILPGLQFIEDTFKTIAGFTAAGFSSLLVPNAPRDFNDIKKDHDQQQRAKAFGRAIAS
jgi:multimeric flavodoxin WrbA